MDTVVIGMDPHKRSATIEVMGSDETVLGQGRYGTHESLTRVCEQSTVCPGQLRTALLTPLQDGELVAQDQDLGSLPRFRTAGQPQPSG